MRRCSPCCLLADQRRVRKLFLYRRQRPAHVVGATAERASPDIITSSDCLVTQAQPRPPSARSSDCSAPPETTQGSTLLRVRRQPTPQPGFPGRDLSQQALGITLLPRAGCPFRPQPTAIWTMAVPASSEKFAKRICLRGPGPADAVLIAAYQ